MSNQAFLKIYGVQRTDVDEQLLFQIAGGQLNVPDLQNALCGSVIGYVFERHEDLGFARDGN